MVDFLLSEAPSAADHSQTLFFDIFRVLRPDGVLALYEPLEGRTFEVSEKLKGALTLAGFINTIITPNPPYVEITSKKPNWEIGATQKISLKKKLGATSSPAAAPPSAWSSSLPADLMDESELLTEIDFVRPGDPMEVVGEDCSTGKGRACANCVCGRADGKGEKKALTLEMLDNPAVESSCGSCALGDAFRCAGCPYRGLPAFKPGERIVMTDDFFQADM
jgi:hypothetical protein